MSFGPGELYALGCAFMWAVAVIFIRKSGESLAPLPLNVFKMVLALGLFLPTLLWVEGAAVPELPATALALALLSGFIGIGLADTLYFRAINTIGASRMAIAQTLYSPSVILLAVLFLGERLSLIQFAGVVLVLSGVLLVTYSGSESRESARDVRRGVLYGGFSVFMMAVAIVMAKPLLEQYAFLWVVTLRMVGGLMGLLLFVSLRGETAKLLADWRAVRQWRYIVLGTVTGAYLSMMLWLAGYKYTDASVAAILNELAAVFILILAAVFLRDRLKPLQWLGSMIAVGGVVLVVWR
jgi:drug/metabolite transporter (DMT)-like permease